MAGKSLDFLHLLSLDLFFIWKEIDTLKISGGPQISGTHILMGPTNFKFVYLSPNGGIINGGNLNSFGV
jgi:hypothetical protein